MKFITNRIYTGKPRCFEDFVNKYKKDAGIKTASVEEENVKVAAEQEEADSSGQLDVEPLHQKGESTEMPKKGPSAKKEGVDGKKTSATDTDPEKEGEDSDQPKAEGSDKFTNKVKFDPKDTPAEENKEKGGEAEGKVKVAAVCEQCEKSCDECKCDKCNCKACTAARGNVQTKEAALEDLPQKVQDKIKGKKSDDKDDADKDAETTGEVKEAQCEPKEAEVKDKKEEEEKEAEVKDEKEEKKEDEEIKEATTDEEKEKDESEEKKSEQKTEFVKFANLDEKNKTFLKNYWRQLYGDDYVAALVADK